MQKLIRRFFDVNRMVPESMRQGELLPMGEAYRNIIRIAVPSVLEMALMSLISMIDTAMVSVLGTDAITAVGLVTQPRLLLLCLFFAMNTGLTAIVARRKGENRRDEANLVLRNVLVITLGMIAVGMAVALPLSKQFMRLAGAGATLEDTNTYFRIIAWSLPVNALSLTICAAQRGVGNTRLTMYVNMTSNLVNVLFNWLLINGIGPFPKWGVKGAAVATAIGLCVGFVLSLISLFRINGGSAFLKLSFKQSWKIRKESVRPVIKVASSALVELVAIRVGFFLFARIVAGLGDDNFAAHQIAMQFLIISFSFGDGVAVASTSLVGQMLGQKRGDLAHMYGKMGEKFAFVLSLLLVALVVLLRKPLVGMFIHTGESGNPEYVRRMAEYLMLVVAVFQPFQMAAVVDSGSLRGAGDTKYVAYVMIFSVLVVRMAICLGLIYLFNNVLNMPYLALFGAWAGSLTDTIVRVFLMRKRFNGGKWHAIKL